MADLQHSRWQSCCAVRGAAELWAGTGLAAGAGGGCGSAAVNAGSVSV